MNKLIARFLGRAAPEAKAEPPSTGHKKQVVYGSISQADMLSYSIKAATPLPVIPLPSPAAKPVTLPSFKTQIGRATSLLPKPDRGLAGKDIVDYRYNNGTNEVLRDLAASNPDLSGTVNAYLRVGLPKDYVIISTDMDGTINVEATKLSYEVLSRLTKLGDPTLGYNPTTDLHSLSEALSREFLLYGAMSAELVLDMAKTGAYIEPVSVTKIQFMEEDRGVYPVQVVAGEEISLDIPTFFYLSCDQDLLTTYSTGMMESAIQAVLADAQFLNDLRRSMKRVIQPRLTATIIEKKLTESLPLELRADSKKLGQFMSEMVAALTDQLQNLEPDEALVSLDVVKYEMLEGKSGNVGEVLSSVRKMIEDKLTAGAKSLPAVLGRDTAGSAAMTSTMLFIKNATILTTKLNVLYSRVLTMAMRLLGHDVMVDFEYGELNLRPEAELEAYKAMKQSRLLEQLSLGLITDEYACLKLTGRLPPEGYTPKAGTMFKTGGSAIVNPDSQTATMGGGKDNLKPDTPAAPKS